MNFVPSFLRDLQIFVGYTYRAFIQPLTKPSFVNSPIDGALRSSKIPKHATSSSWTPIALKYFIAPSMPILSGSSCGSSELLVSQISKSPRNNIPNTSIFVEYLSYFRRISRVGSVLEISVRRVSHVSLHPSLEFRESQHNQRRNMKVCDVSVHIISRSKIVPTLTATAYPQQSWQRDAYAGCQACNLPSPVPNKVLVW